MSLTLVTCASRDEGRSFQGQTLFHFTSQNSNGQFSFLAFLPLQSLPMQRTEPFKRPKTLHACNSCPCAWEKQVSAHPACLLVSTRAEHEQALLIQQGGFHGMPPHCLWDSFPYTVCTGTTYLNPPGESTGGALPRAIYVAALLRAQHGFRKHFRLLQVVLVHLSSIPFFVLAGLQLK